MSETQSASSEARVVAGRVVSDGMAKSVTVYVERRVKHELYGKYVRRSSRILAHDENDEAARGDLVEITECAPYSKRKAWRLVRVVERAGDVGAAG